MTRGYKRDVIQGIDFTENGKEFHLEVLLKLYSLGYGFGEIPAVLEWKKFDETKPKRKSSTKILKIMRSHLKFLFFIRPLKYFWVISLVLISASLLYLTRGVYNIFIGIVGFETFADGLKSLLFAIFGIIFFGFGIFTEQNLTILKELWKKK